MKTSLKLFIILTCLVLMWSYAKIQLGESQQPNQMANASEVLQQLHLGMTATEVQAIIQQPENNHTKLLNPEREIRLWWLTSNDFICIVYKDGHVIKWIENTSGYNVEKA